MSETNQTQTNQTTVKGYTTKGGKKVGDYKRKAPQSGPRRGANPEAAVAAAFEADTAAAAAAAVVAAAETDTGANSVTAVHESQPITDTGEIMEPTEADVRRLFDIIERADRGEFATDEESVWVTENSNHNIIQNIREVIHRASYVRVSYDADTVFQNLMDELKFKNEFQKEWREEMRQTMENRESPATRTKV